MNEIVPYKDNSPGPTAYRTPPHNYEAEKALLGAILANNDCLAKVADFLRPDHFADAINGRIYEAICSIVDRAGGGIADPITLRNLFESDGALTEIGGIRYLADLVASMVSIINAEDYGRLIFDLAVKRQIMTLGEQMIHESHEAELAPKDLISSIEGRLSVLVERDTRGIPQDPDSQIRRMLTGLESAARGERFGRSTGFTAIDRLIGGLLPETLYIIAARPSMGKSALALALTEPWVKIDGHLVRPASNTFAYSGEMPGEQWHRRRVGQAIKLPVSQMRQDIDADTFDRIYQASQQLDRSLYIDDTPRLTFEAIRRRAIRHAERHPLELVVVDHLGKVAHRDPDSRDKVGQIGEITGGLKDLSKELKVPVVCLVQLNRGVEGRDDKRPGLQDLRGSGNIEEDADMVGFLYREAYYLEKSPPVRFEKEGEEAFITRMAKHESRLAKTRNLAELIIGKNRDGPCETARIYWNGPLMMFGNLRQDEPATGYDADMESFI